MALRCVSVRAADYCPDEAREIFAALGGTFEFAAAAVLDGPPAGPRWIVKWRRVLRVLAARVVRCFGLWAIELWVDLRGYVIFGDERVYVFGFEMSLCMLYLFGRF